MKYKFFNIKLQHELKYARLLNMDTEMKPVFADYRYNVTEDGIISTEGTFSVELVRNVLSAYSALTKDDKDRLDKLFAYADKTGTPINE